MIEEAAVLGPQGSFSELALHKFCNPKKVSYCFSIAEVFEALHADRVNYGFVPIENMLQGAVSETIDLLYEYRGAIQITESFAMPIIHCIGILPDASHSKINAVYSHVQALRQCTHFLNGNFSQAARNPTSSTSEAAAYVANKSMTTAAVIASEESLNKHGFKILHKNIANRTHNKTRFVLLHKSNTSKPLASPSVSASEDHHYVTSLVVDPGGRDRKGLLHEILSLVSIEYGLNLLSIHSRPDMKGGFVFHLDIEGSKNENKIKNCVTALRDYCKQATGHTAAIIIYGSYPKARFIERPFSTVGIVGGNGIMGTWFTNFLEAAGYHTLIYDRASKEKRNQVSLAQLVTRSDVILLSVPITSLDEVLNQIAPLLKEETLVVENCSIKHCSLPLVLEKTPEFVEVLGIHTMFGGNIETLKHQNVLITRTERSGEKAEAFESLLYKHGASISQVSIDEHDKLSAFVQSLTHCLMLSLGEVMAECFPNKEVLESFSTPNSRALMASCKRISNQHENLIQDLQRLNPEYKPILNKFLETFFSAVAEIHSNNYEGLVDYARNTKKFLE